MRPHLPPIPVYCIHYIIKIVGVPTLRPYWTFQSRQVVTCGVLTPGWLSRTVRPYRMESDRERAQVSEATDEPLSSGLLTALTDLGRNSANAIAGAVSSKVLTPRSEETGARCED